MAAPPVPAPAAIQQVEAARKPAKAQARSGESAPAPEKKPKLPGVQPTKSTQLPSRIPTKVAAAPKTGPLKVLFVDDSLSVRKVAEKLLGSLGVQVTVAVDGLDALAKLRETTFDLVFTDLEMPRMHGYEFIRELRFVPAYKDLPIVVVSSRSGQKHQDQARSLGATDYITKPFNAESLDAALKKWARGGG